MSRDYNLQTNCGCKQADDCFLPPSRPGSGGQPPVSHWTLLYWISSRSFQEVNFIQLRRLPEHIINSSREVYNILNNMMEMLMPLYFRTLPQAQPLVFLAGHEHLQATSHPQSARHSNGSHRMPQRITNCGI